MLTNHKEVCLSINGAQSVRLEKETIEFKKYFKQIPVPFKIYADFECNLRGVECYEDHIPCSFDYKVVYVDDRFNKRIVVYRGENVVYEFINAILKEYTYCKKVMNKHFNENLIMSEEEEHLLQRSNSCWTCKKLVDNVEEKVRDHWHVTGKFRGAVHGSCNMNLQLTKKVPVIFHNLRGYDSHLIFSELDQFDVKISVIPNGLEEYMEFFFNKNLVFINSMKFMNSSLDKLVKNLSDEDLKKSLVVKI